MSPTEFSHCALLYRSEEELLDGVLHFLEPGLEAGEPVFVALDSERLHTLESRLGAPSGRAGVEWLDIRQVGRNPGRLIPTFAGAFGPDRDRAVHFVGEAIWPGRDADEVSEVLVHEALMNLAFEGKPIRALCPYDASSLDAEVIARARRSHPSLIEDGGARACADYVEDAFPACCSDPLPPAPLHSSCLEFTVTDLPQVRALVAGAAEEAGLGPDRREDLVLAVNELATNSIRHGGGNGEVCTWTRGERLVCEVRDGGVIGDPLAGRLPPRPDAAGGRGLWLVHQLVDLAQVRTGNSGTTVRVHAAPMQA